jgi:hypothetical protein
MEDAELIRETNELLRRIVQMDEEAKQESAKWQEEFERRSEQSDEEFNANVNQRLMEQGFSESELAGGPRDWEDRLQELRTRTQQQAQETLNLDRKYKEDVLAELREQTRLMTEIAQALKQ